MAHNVTVIHFEALTFIILETSQMQTLPLLVAAARNCGQLPKPQQAILSELSGLFGNWAGLVASVTDSGTFCVCSPFTNGQLGECRSCSDLGSSGEMLLSLINHQNKKIWHNCSPASRCINQKCS